MRPLAPLIVIIDTVVELMSLMAKSSHLQFLFQVVGWLTLLLGLCYLWIVMAL